MHYQEMSINMPMSAQASMMSAKELLIYLPLVQAAGGSSSND